MSRLGDPDLLLPTARRPLLVLHDKSLSSPQSVVVLGVRPVTGTVCSPLVQILSGAQCANSWNRSSGEHSGTGPQWSRVSPVVPSTPCLSPVTLIEIQLNVWPITRRAGLCCAPPSNQRFNYKLELWLVIEKFPPPPPTGTHSSPPPHISMPHFFIVKQKVQNHLLI